jgi:hypothetical protein
LKQYISDVVVCFSLLLLALRVDILKTRSVNFAIIWVLAGSVAIWLSMPAVFILAAAMLYYAIMAIQSRRYSKIVMLAIVGILWLAQFAFYYYTILKPQAESEYLQRCHKEYFFFLMPCSREEFIFNWNLTLYPLENAGGHTGVPVVLHALCIIVAIIYFVKQRMTNAILIVTPLVLLYIAAALHKFTLIPRVTLFALPLILILISAGLGRLFELKNKYLNVVLIAACIIGFVNFNALKHFVVPMENEEMKKSLDFLSSQHINGSQLFVHNFGGPAYLYYTTIHPEKPRWSNLTGATILNWDTDYNAVSASWVDTTAVLFGWEEEEKIHQKEEAMKQYNTEINRFVTTGGKVFIFRKN